MNTEKFTLFPNDLYKNDDLVMICGYYLHEVFDFPKDTKEIYLSFYKTPSNNRVKVKVYYGCVCLDDSEEIILVYGSFSRFLEKQIEGLGTHNNVLYAALQY